tara:strand:+ start:41 stop:670 length:630 start_codon:yes stop_codon:yes gene_type:complete
MANLIIKSSADNLVLQGSDASPAITVGATGTTTFAENVTLSGTGNNIGTVTAGTIENPPGGVTQKAFGFSAWLSSATNITNATWTESGSFGTWTERWDTDGKFASGRFTPTIQGIYLCGYSVRFNSSDDDEYLQVQLRVNGGDGTGATTYAYSRAEGVGSDTGLSLSGSSLVQLDTNDYVSTYVVHQEGTDQPLITNQTEFWGIYMGQV